MKIVCKIGHRVLIAGPDADLTEARAELAAAIEAKRQHFDHCMQGGTNVIEELAPQVREMAFGDGSAKKWFLTGTIDVET